MQLQQAGAANGAAAHSRVVKCRFCCIPVTLPGAERLGGGEAQMRQQALQTGLTLCGQGAAGHKRCSAEGGSELQALPPCYLAAVLFCRCRGEWVRA